MPLVSLFRQAVAAEPAGPHMRFLLYMQLQGCCWLSAMCCKVIWPPQRSHLHRVPCRRVPQERTGPSLETAPAAAVAVLAVALRPHHELLQRKAGLDVCLRQQLGKWDVGSVHTSEAESTSAELCAVI